MAVRVGHQRPRRAEHPRQADERPGGQPWQLRIKARWQVDADLADLHVHQVVIVGQPLSGRRRVVPVLGGLRQGAIGSQEERGVVRQAVRQSTVPGPACRHRLRGGQAPCMLLQAFRAEQLGPHQCPLPCKNGRPVLEYTANDHRSARADPRSLTVTASAPEQTSAALRRGGAAQQRVPTQVGTIVHPEFAATFAISPHQPVSTVRRTFRRRRLGIAGRQAVLGFAHAILRCCDPGALQTETRLDGRLGKYSPFGPRPRWRSLFRPPRSRAKRPEWSGLSLSLARHHLRLSIQRQMIGVACHQHMCHRRFGGQAAFDQPRRRG